MKPLFAALALALAAGPVWAADSDSAAVHPFSIRDLVMMDRVGDPQLSPDGHYAAYTVRVTDYAANKGLTSIYVLDLDKGGAAVKVVEKGSSPRWAPDGQSLFYTAAKDGVTQLWRRNLGGTGKGLALSAGAGDAITDAPLDVNSFKLSPDGSKVLLTFDVFTDCADLACTKERLDGREKDKSTGTVYDKIFVRHWDTWADGRRAQLYVADVTAGSQPLLLSRGIDGDVPSKPFGGDDEFSFSPDGRTVYFDARIAGKSEPWSTNFDVYSVPVDASAAPTNLTEANLAWDANPLPSPDGKTLYYTAMKDPGSEADRFAIMALDLASGSKREVAPSWDRTAGALQISRDGKTLYTTTDDNGQHPLFAIDVATGKVTTLVTDGSVGAFDARGANRLLLSRDDLKHPADLYTADLHGKGLKQVTHYNAKRIKSAQTGDFEFFTFKGANGDTVQGYVVKPVGYKKGKTYPVAFIIHGGPQGAMTNSWSYRWNAQTYAGQGFAVVTVNFHGSTGYGQAFTDSISGDWGGKPLVDLQQGWKAALGKYNFLDGDRACALGASYGGYMVYWIAGVWNQPWKCLVDHDGVFDARAMYYDTEELWFEEKENGGTQYDHPENYERFNPINHVKDWRVPMLVIHGGKDFRIPETQGMGAFTALQRRGIPSQFLHFPDENHWVLKPQNSVQWHETVNAWLKQWTAKDAK
ncbi:dipeptidyl aminopeptidase/acylaminoacyl peptidase [Luteibacter sp. Sphag1AF]|uniref:dipeptidyl-peptidase 5 n=1 Tax=Luteibacter sp. Sphag1AF TaxID=2587031 RepID=UPI00161D8057|nr:S9 family peptidase [Luteibacter sp. Sphag1AF]MBB3225419.1 dipeptidyl aminopeptidase/acylaminoacyl peptidase [Luteibacter sp. Sphag1AF]